MGIIAIDWGSSNCHAYLLRDGKIVSRQETGRGLKSIDAEQFGPEFDTLVAPWRDDADTALLFGMVTSKHGWVETPYLPCPATAEQLRDGAITRLRDGMILRFLPGLCQSMPEPDVMRGEEMQMFGLPSTPEPRVVVLPGTHSKWAIMSGGVVEKFRTIITGEIFQVLLDHSLAGRLATSTVFNKAAFVKAVRRGYDSKMPLADVFSARSSVLLGALDGDDVHSHLSGLLIGCEIREGLSLMLEGDAGISLVGAQHLTDLYNLAFSELGFVADVHLGEISITGVLRVLKDVAA